MASKNAYTKCAACGTEFVPPGPDVLKCGTCRDKATKSLVLRIGKGSPIAAAKVSPDGPDYNGHLVLELHAEPMGQAFCEAVERMLGPDLAPVAIDHLERLSLLRALMEAAK